MEATKEQRIAVANEAIKIIASHGRKFFSLHSDWGDKSAPNRISHFELRGGRLWFVDKYTQKPTYVAYRRGRWRHFTEGGTLRSLVEAMADWIVGKRDDFPRAFGPWPQWLCDGDLWGYGDSMESVRREIGQLTNRVEVPARLPGRDPRPTPRSHEI